MARKADVMDLVPKSGKEVVTDPDDKKNDFTTDGLAQTGGDKAIDEDQQPKGGGAPATVIPGAPLKDPMVSSDVSTPVIRDGVAANLLMKTARQLGKVDPALARRLAKVAQQLGPKPGDITTATLELAGDDGAVDDGQEKGHGQLQFFGTDKATKPQADLGATSPKASRKAVFSKPESIILLKGLHSALSEFMARWRYMFEVSPGSGGVEKGVEIYSLANALHEKIERALGREHSASLKASRQAARLTLRKDMEGRLEVVAEVESEPVTVSALARFQTLAKAAAVKRGYEVVGEAGVTVEEGGHDMYMTIAVRKVKQPPQQPPQKPQASRQAQESPTVQDPEQNASGAQGAGAFVGEKPPLKDVTQPGDVKTPKVKEAAKRPISLWKALKQTIKSASRTGGDWNGGQYGVEAQDYGETVEIEAQAQDREGTPLTAGVVSMTLVHDSPQGRFATVEVRDAVVGNRTTEVTLRPSDIGPFAGDWIREIKGVARDLLRN